MPTHDPAILYTTIPPLSTHPIPTQRLRFNIPFLPRHRRWCRGRLPWCRPRLHITRWGRNLRDPDPLRAHERLERTIRRHDALQPLLQHGHQTRVDDGVAGRVGRGAHEIARVRVLVHVRYKRRVHGGEAALGEEFEQRCVDGIGGRGRTGTGVGGSVGALEGAGVGCDAKESGGDGVDVGKDG